VGLGHRRLAIIALEGGKQPLANEDETVWITFNGEIYNFQELRQHLESRGHKFRTHSDTETIVAFASSLTKRRPERSVQRTIDNTAMSGLIGISGS
jgi:asparagine synthetase B (glutamine-hydrolysing)